MTRTNLNQVIEIVVSPAGDTRLETLGFAGASCRDVSRFLEQALGQCTSERFTAEFHATSSAVSQQQSRT